MLAAEGVLALLMDVTLHVSRHSNMLLDASLLHAFGWYRLSPCP
jgi:hypothetical protein